MHRCSYLVLHHLKQGGWIALNGLSGAIDILDDSAKESLDLAAIDSNGHIDPDLLERLHRRGYLFDNADAEERLLRSQWERSQRRVQEQPLRFALCPTHSCNLACRYCFEGSVTSRKTLLLTDEAIAAAFRAIDGIAAQHPSRKVEIDLFGGEPLLPITEGAIRRILREVQARGMVVGVVTNGTHLSTTYRKLLAEFCHLFTHFQITVDGPPTVHDGRRPFRSGKGSFDLINDGVELLLSLGIRVALRVNLDGDNVHHLPELAEMLIRRGWAGRDNLRCQLAPVADHLGSGGYTAVLPEDQLVRELASVMASSEAVRKLFKMDLFRSARHLGSVLGLTNLKAQPMYQYCEANSLSSYTLAADGYIYPCSEMLDQPELALGTFFPSFEMDEQKAAPWKSRSILSIPACRACPVATFCGGGCAYQALKKNGSVMEPACFGAEKVIAAFLDCFSDRLSSH